MIKNTNEVTVYETNGQEVKTLTSNPLVVKSHWNRDKLVVLQIPGTANTITVSANDLIAAINNATNINRFL